jgi:thiol-disulfide isomerase/thioredoxin
MKVFKFFSPHCAPCKQLGAEFDKLKEQYPSLEVIDVDITEDFEQAVMFKVRTVPTVVTEDGNKTFVGFMKAEKIVEFLNL